MPYVLEYKVVVQSTELFAEMQRSRRGQSTTCLSFAISRKTGVGTILEWVGTTLVLLRKMFPRALEFSLDDDGLKSAIFNASSQQNVYL